MNNDSFFSMDRLLEFGMGMAMAQQMIGIMNESMKNMYVPGAMNPMPTVQTSYYALLDNVQVGPFSEQELSRLIADKKVNKETYIWRPGMQQWQKAMELPEVLKLVALAPPPFPTNQ